MLCHFHLTVYKLLLLLDRQHIVLLSQVPDEQPARPTTERQLYRPGTGDLLLVCRADRALVRGVAEWIRPRPDPTALNPSH